MNRDAIVHAASVEQVIAKIRDFMPEKRDHKLSLPLLRSLVWTHFHTANISLTNEVWNEAQARALNYDPNNKVVWLKD